MIEGFESFMRVFGDTSIKINDAYQIGDSELAAELNAAHNRYLMFGEKLPETPFTLDSFPRLWYTRIFTPVSAISNSLTTLRNIHIYIGRFPYRGTSVDEVAHLTDNVNFFLQEVFVLRERLIAFLNIIYKTEYKSDLRSKDITRICELLCRYVKSRVKPLTEARRYHTHLGGYEEPGLASLVSLRTYAILWPDSDTKEILKRQFSFRYKEERSLWKKTIGGWVAEIERALDFYFLSVGRILFTEDDGFIPPAEWPAG